MKKGIILTLLTVMMAFAMNAQKKKRYDYGPDSANCVMNMSLYEEYYSAKAYKDALPSWRKVVDICPKARKSFYINGAKMYKQFIKDAAEDSITKFAHVDTLMWIYDKRIENHGQEAYVLGRKGVDHFKFFRDSDPCASYEILKKSVELGKEKTEAVVLSTYYQSMYKCYRLDKVEKATLFTEYLTVSDYININIKSLSKDLETGTSDKKLKKLEKRRVGFEKAKKNLDEFFIKLAKCEDILKIFQERVEANPDDFELKKKTLKVMNKRACEDSDFYLEIAKAVHAKEPSAESAYAIAVKEAKNSNISQAMTFFQEAVDLCNGCPEEVNYLIKAAKTAVASKQYSKARAFAKRVLKIEPNNGEAIIVLGDVVRYSPCKDGKAGVWSRQWLAVDYYARAKARDSSVSEKANKRIGSCKASYPEASEVFMFGLKEGDAYTHCNGETTKVRLK